MARGPKFHIADIPVTVDPSFFLVIGIFGVMSPGITAFVIWMVLVTVSVLIHELGHAVAFRAYGSDAAIQLHGLGGITTGRRLPPARSLVVSLAGPLAGLIILGLPAVWLSSSGLVNGPTWELVLTYGIFINVFWSLVNLLPVLPLDGGNVVHSLLSLATGHDAERGTRYISIGVAAFGGGLGLLFQLPVVVLLAGLALVLNVSALRRPTGGGRSELLTAGQRLLARGDSWGAVQQVEPLVATSTSPADRAAAADLQTWAWLLAGEQGHARLAQSRRPDGQPMPATLQGALAVGGGLHDQGIALLTFGFVNEPPGPDQLFASFAVARLGVTEELASELLRMESDRGVDAAVTLASLLHHGGRFAEAAKTSSLLYRDGRSDRDVMAFNTACSLARGGWLDDSLGWLVVAADAGWSDAERLAEDPDLVAVRSHPAYAEIARRLATPHLIP